MVLRTLTHYLNNQKKIIVISSILDKNDNEYFKIETETIRIRNPFSRDYLDILLHEQIISLINSNLHF